MINELEQIKQRILKEYEASGLPVIYAEAYCDEMMLPMSDGAALKTYIFRGCKDGAMPVILQRSPYAHALEIASRWSCAACPFSLWILYPWVLPL